jgi:hypothetical protein
MDERIAAEWDAGQSRRGSRPGSGAPPGCDYPSAIISQMKSQVLFPDEIVLFRPPRGKEIRLEE